MKLVKVSDISSDFEEILSHSWLCREFLMFQPLQSRRCRALGEWRGWVQARSLGASWQKKVRGNLAHGSFGVEWGYAAPQVAGEGAFGELYHKSEQIVGRLAQCSSCSVQLLVKLAAHLLIMHLVKVASCLKKYPSIHQIFLNADPASRHGLPHKFAFMPFSHGPRACIGREFTLLEQKITLVSRLEIYKSPLMNGRLMKLWSRLVWRSRNHETIFVYINVLCLWGDARWNSFRTLILNKYLAKRQVWSAEFGVCFVLFAPRNYPIFMSCLRRCLDIHQWKQMVYIHLS